MLRNPGHRRWTATSMVTLADAPFPGTTTSVGRAIFTGMLIAFAGSIPRSLLFAANLRYYNSTP